MVSRSAKNASEKFSCLGSFKETAEIETGMAEKSSWGQANRQQKHGLVSFFLLII
jgi:hypothetical protein